jgi:hypothetical protein
VGVGVRKWVWVRARVCVLGMQRAKGVV